jgi:hypothetical protein
MRIFLENDDGQRQRDLLADPPTDKISTTCSKCVLRAVDGDCLTSRSTMIFLSYGEITL